jgi:hypothetical protein
MVKCTETPNDDMTNKGGSLLSELIGPVAPHRKIHGEPVPLWARLKLQELSPVPCAFHVGDIVCFTNEYGLQFDCDVIGFSEDSSFQGRFIHLARRGYDVNGSAWWFPHRPDELAHIQT